VEATGGKLVDRVTKAFDELQKSGKSSEEIFATLYYDLKQLARMKVAQKPAGPSMSASRLLSDLYVRLFENHAEGFQWESGPHFFNTMARVMEHILIDRARGGRKRGRGMVDSLEGLKEGGFEPGDLIGAGPTGKNLPQANVEQALMISEALEHLENDHSGSAAGARISERQAEIIRLRSFLGFTEDEVAEVLGCSSETVKKEFRKAKAKIFNYLHGEPAES